ncbi:MAG: aromatic ring-hydroxylating oxygenase subunit alpha, partial [bacterium]
MNIPLLIKQKGDLPFKSNAGESFTMPARFYTDSAIYAAEKEAIFYCSWWYAGHISQLASPGQYITTKIHDQNIFIICDREQGLRAFYNVCQHRGHELLSGSGRTNVIVCPYHAWAYDFDGNLKAARNSENVKGFNSCDFTLKDVRVEEFCGMVFVNLDPDAAPLVEQAPGLDKEIRDICPEVDTLRIARRDTYDVSSNWKVMVDNFLECYHCHVAHRDFVDLVDMESYRSKSNGIYSSHISKSIRSADNNAFKLDS